MRLCFFQAEDGIRGKLVTGVQTCALPIWFLDDTAAFWRAWVRNLGIPYEWQENIIRAAITLKLNAYEDTGAIVAAGGTPIRAEERRGGEEGRSRGAPDPLKKKSVRVDIAL